MLGCAIGRGDLLVRLLFGEGVRMYTEYYNKIKCTCKLKCNNTSLVPFTNTVNYTKNNIHSVMKSAGGENSMHKKKLPLFVLKNSSYRWLVEIFLSNEYFLHSASHNLS